jgi:cell division septation protein DedD
MRLPNRLVASLVLAASLALPVVAHANEAYDKVAGAYARGGGQLAPCAFTQPELEAAIRGIPPAIRRYVPALRRAIEAGIAAHERGDCKGVKPEEGTTGGARVGGPASKPTTTAPPVTTPPVTTPPATTQTAPAVPGATTPSTGPATTQPATATTTPERDRTPLVIALIAAGALVLLTLLLWGLGRMRGWDPAWAARTRHGWGEAGFRTTSTWSEFTDWLRLGR